MPLSLSLSLSLSLVVSDAARIAQMHTPIRDICSIIHLCTCTRVFMLVPYRRNTVMKHHVLPFGGNWAAKNLHRFLSTLDHKHKAQENRETRRNERNRYHRHHRHYHHTNTIRTPIPILSLSLFLSLFTTSQRAVAILNLN